MMSTQPGGALLLTQNKVLSGQAPCFAEGKVVEIREVGGLHHH